MQNQSSKAGRTAAGKREQGKAQPSLDHGPVPGDSAFTLLTPAQLAREIAVAHQGVETEIHTARQHASAALMNALRAGALLCEVYSREGKKGWGGWVAKHCPQLSTSTMYRYWGLARKFPHVRKPEEIKSLRQAYIAVGILPEPGEKEEPNKTPNLSTVPLASGTDLASRVHSAWEFLGPQLEQIDPSTLETTERQRLRQELSTLRDGLDAVLARLDRTPSDHPADHAEPSNAAETQP